VAEKLLALCAYLTVLTTILIVYILLTESFQFFKTVSMAEFMFGTRWEPLLDPKSFGVLPLLFGTLMIVVGSAFVCIPIGLTTAIFLSQYASKKVRRIIKPVLEVLAGIPTVVYGYFALTFITPILRIFIPDTEIFNALSGAIVVGIMILPMVASLCDDALQAVPKSLKQGGYALGTTSYEVTTGIMIPSAFSGIMASFVLAISRAFGETMAVTLAAGATPRFTLNPLESIQTMTAYIVQVSLGDTPAGGIEYQTIFAVAGLLFLVTLVMNLLSNFIMNKYREVYE
jgi:phosphate transport system permease protein